MIEKANYKGQIKEKSYDTGSSYLRGHQNKNLASSSSPEYADSNRNQEQVTADPQMLTNTRTHSRVPPHAILEPYVSRDELLKKLTQSQNRNSSESMSMSDSSLVVTHAEPIVNIAGFPAVSTLVNAGIKREDRYPTSDFVEIIANGSYPYAVYSPTTSTSSTTTSTTTTTTEKPRYFVPWDSPEPVRPVTSVPWTTPDLPWIPTKTSTPGTTMITTLTSTTQEMETTVTTTPTTTTPTYKPLKPPNHVNALTIIQSPTVISNGSEVADNKISSSEQKFSKLIGIEEPPAMVKARLEKEKRKKEKEAQEKLLALMAKQQIQYQMAASNNNFHNKYQLPEKTTTPGGQKFMQLFYQRNPFSSNSNKQKLQDDVSQMMGLSSSRIPLPAHPPPTHFGKSHSVMHALQSSLGYGFPSTSSPSSFLKDFDLLPTQNTVNSIIKSGTLAGKSVLNRLASYRPLQMMLPSIKNFKSQQNPSSHLVSPSLFPLHQPHHMLNINHHNNQQLPSTKSILQTTSFLEGHQTQNLAPLLAAAAAPHLNPLTGAVTGSEGSKKTEVVMTPDKLLTSWILNQGQPNYKNQETITKTTTQSP